MSHLKRIRLGYEIITHPTSDEFAEVAAEIGAIIRGQLSYINLGKALQMGILVFQIIQMYRAKDSLSAKMFHVINTAQPDGHPLTSIAYAVGGLIDDRKTAFVADTARDAKVAMNKITAPPPTDEEIATKLKELAELGLKVLVVKENDATAESDVETAPPLHVV